MAFWSWKFSLILYTHVRKNMMLAVRRTRRPRQLAHLSFWSSSSADAKEDKEDSHAQFFQATEPAEATSPQLYVTPQKAAQLFTKRENRMAKLPMPFGAAIAAGGVGLLAYGHTDWWMNLDFAGGALLATGGAVAVFGPGLLNGGGDRGSDKSYDDEDYEGRFSFTLWNDRALRKADLSSISDLCESDLLARLPAEVNTLITKASEEEKKCTDEKAKEQREAIVKQIEEDLEAGLSVARVKQKLQPRCFVLDFDDTGVRRPPGATKRIIAQFTDAISILLATVSPYDEVVVKITSPGGAVTEYGLASSQLLRLRKAGIATTVCVDTVAASG
jgi:hypothetical protein